MTVHRVRRSVRIPTARTRILNPPIKTKSRIERMIAPAGVRRSMYLLNLVNTITPP